MDQPLSGKDSLFLARMVLIAEKAKGRIREIPLALDWKELVRHAELLRDRGERCGCFEASVCLK